MREILFRGKFVDNGEWLYGSLFHDPDLEKFSIMGFDYPIEESGPVREEFMSEVATSTVGQYTGLTDKNGVKIFEGDVLSYYDEDGGHKGAVYYDSGEYWVSAPDGEETEDTASLIYAVRNANEYVIGNIHDNPELIEG